MARKRMINPGIWTSEQVAGLTLRQRLLYIGLISNADDAGKLKGSAAYVKSIIFPYDSIPPSVIETDLVRIAKSALIERYKTGVNWYIRHPNWCRHQYIQKPQPSVIPDPPGGSPIAVTEQSVTRIGTTEQQHKRSELNTNREPLRAPVFKDSLALLLSLNIPKAKASALAGMYPYDRIKAVCEYAKRGRRPTGMAIDALEKGWKV